LTHLARFLVALADLVEEAIVHLSLKQRRDA